MSMVTSIDLRRRNQLNHETDRVEIKCMRQSSKQNKPWRAVARTLCHSLILNRADPRVY